LIRVRPETAAVASSALPCTADAWPAFSRLLDHALDLGPEARPAWLAGLTGADAQLRPALERVLAGDRPERLASFLSEPPPIPEARPAGADDAGAAGARIGPWQLLRELGRGGMGVVWLARRADAAYERDVALKLPLAHLANERQRARFGRERDILASLQHASIAQLYDAGVTADGQPWLALEFVAGEPLLAWCDARRLTVAQRLRLLLPVAAAVQHAHRNLVVHRDIKPGNILVSADGVPKLLDFGIARLVDQTDPEQTQTQAMTPAYATPEQQRGGPVTTASDVYQLGLVLYELLGGVAAHRARAPGSSAIPRLDQACAHLQSSDPMLAARVAGARSSTPARLRTQLSGDLTRILERALAEAPADRYGSAAELADDLDRHLHQRPVQAARGHLGYRLRKFIARNPRAIAVVGSLAVALATSLVLAQRDSARQLAQVSAERSRAEASLAFLGGLFESAGPNSRHGADASARDILLTGIERLRNDRDLEPRSRAELLVIIGESLNGLSQVREAAQAFELAAAEQARFAATVAERARLRLRRAINQQNSGDVAGAAQAAQALVEDVLREGLDDHSALNAHALRANLYLIEGDVERAGRALAPALALLAQRPDAFAPIDHADVLTMQGHILTTQGRPDPALAAAEHALALYRQVDPDHPSVGLSLGLLGLIQMDRGELPAAQALYQDAIARIERVLGRDNRDLLIARGNYASVLLRLGQAGAAADQVRESLRAMQAMGLDDPITEGRTRNRLGQALFDAGERDDAQAQWRQALALAQRAGDQVVVERAEAGLAALSCLAGQPDQLPVLRARAGGDDLDPAWRLRGGLMLAGCLEALDQPAQAQAEYRRLGGLLADGATPPADHSHRQVADGIARTAR
jgi:serine/threonine-protein kinase